MPSKLDIVFDAEKIEYKESEKSFELKEGCLSVCL